MHVLSNIYFGTKSCSEYATLTHLDLMYVCYHGNYTTGLTGCVSLCYQGNCYTIYCYQGNMYTLHQLPRQPVHNTKTMCKHFLPRQHVHNTRVTCTMFLYQPVHNLLLPKAQCYTCHMYTSMLSKYTMFPCQHVHNVLLPRQHVHNVTQTAYIHPCCRSTQCFHANLYTMYCYQGNMCTMLHRLHVYIHVVKVHMFPCQHVHNVLLPRQHVHNVTQAACIHPCCQNTQCFFANLYTMYCY